MADTDDGTEPGRTYVDPDNTSIPKNTTTNSTPIPPPTP